MGLSLPNALGSVFLPGKFTARREGFFLFRTAHGFREHYTANKIEGQVKKIGMALPFLNFIRAPCFEPQTRTLRKQLARLRLPRVTQEVPLSAAAFLP